VAERHKSSYAFSMRSIEIKHRFHNKRLKNCTFQKGRKVLLCYNFNKKGGCEDYDCATFQLSAIRSFYFPHIQTHIHTHIHMVTKWSQCPRRRTTSSARNYSEMFMSKMKHSHVTYGLHTTSNYKLQTCVWALVNPVLYSDSPSGASLDVFLW